MARYKMVVVTLRVGRSFWSILDTQDDKVSLIYPRDTLHDQTPYVRVVCKWRAKLNNRSMRSPDFVWYTTGGYTVEDYHREERG